MNAINNLNDFMVDRDRIAIFSPIQATLPPDKQEGTFLSSVPDGALIELLSNAKTVAYNKNAIIVSEGSVGSSLYIILSGKAKVFSTDDKFNREVTLLIQRPGSCFGEIAMLTNATRSASVMALEKTVCAVIGKDDFMNWLLKYPEMAINLLKELSTRIAQLTDKARQMALLNVYERTVNILKEMAIVEGDVSVIHNKPTQQDLASLVGASRELVSRIMSDLTKGGYVKTDKTMLIINKKLPASW